MAVILQESDDNHLQKPPVSFGETILPEGFLPERWIPFEHPFKEAIFMERPNRFIGVFHFPDELPGETEPRRGHIADPGRLKELLYPGARVLVVDHGESDSPQREARKMRYSIPLVWSPDGPLVSINAQLPNRLVRHLLEHQTLPGFEGYSLIRPEVKVGHSRIDFLLTGPQGQSALVEVKGASLVENGVCLFPDAVTERGTRHLETLIEAQQDGMECHVVIVIQRDDARQFSPHQQRDPAFAAAVVHAVAVGVQVHPIPFCLTPQGASVLPPVPLVLP